MTPKNKKFDNPSTTHKFCVDLGPKRYLGPRDPIIGSMGYGGSKLKVQGTDSYPVNECIYVNYILYIYTVNSAFKIQLKYQFEIGKNLKEN